MKLSKKFPHKSKLAVASGALALLAACGGGHDQVGVVSANTENSKSGTASEAGVVELLSRASSANIGRVIYVVGSGNLGAYGRLLSASGYTFKYGVDVLTLPDAASSVIYLSTDSASGFSEADWSRLSAFKGVVIVDSEKVVKPLPEIAAEVEDDAAGVQRAAEASGSGETGTAVVVGVSEIYLKISGGQATALPNTTAAMTSGLTGTVVPIDVDIEGRANGYASDNFEAVGPQLFALQAKDAAEGKFQKPEKPARVAAARDKPKNIAGVSWDRVIDINRTNDGYNFRGRAYALAWREAAPTFVNARKFVDVILDSGSNEVGCMVSGLPCGVYPNSKKDVVTSYQEGGLTKVKSAPYLYFAQVGIKPFQQTMQWQPKASHWTSASTKETDSWETVWSEGISIGGSLGSSLTTFGSFSLGFSGGYSRSNTYRKKTYAWTGWDSAFTTESGTRGWAASGLQSVNRKVRGAVESGIWLNGTANANWVRMNDLMLNGLYAQCVYGLGDPWCVSQTQKVNGDGSPRSKIAYGGWNPAISTSQEIPKSTFASPTATNTVSVNVQFGAARDRWHFEKRSTSIRCWSENLKDGYVLKGSPAHCDASNVQSANATNSSPYTVAGAVVSFTLPASAFNN